MKYVNTSDPTTTMTASKRLCIIRITTPSTPMPRTQMPDLVEGWVNFDTGVVELSFLYDIGEVTIELYSSYGLVGIEFIDTAVEPYINLNIDTEPDNYRLIIYGNKYAAEAYFE